jgi:hypothetical protein
MEAMQANDRNATLAIGSVRTQDQAERLIEILKRAGFSDQDVSVILPDDKLIQDPKIAWITNQVTILPTKTARRFRQAENSDRRSGIGRNRVGDYRWFDRVGQPCGSPPSSKRR